MLRFEPGNESLDPQRSEDDHGNIREDEPFRRKPHAADDRQPVEKIPVGGQITTRTENQRSRQYSSPKPNPTATAGQGESYKQQDGGPNVRTDEIRQYSPGNVSHEPRVRHRRGVA